MRAELVRQGVTGPLARLIRRCPNRLCVLLRVQVEPMAEPDELYTLRQEFWVGNFHAALSEANSLDRLPESLKQEKLEFVYRSHIGLKDYDVPLREIKDGAPTALQAVKLLAVYETSVDQRQMVLMTLQEWLNDTTSASSATLQLIAAIIFLQEGMVKDALRTIRHGVTLEQRALTASIYLRMDRPDQATAQLKSMQEADEDSTLSQLTAAWIDLYVGGSRYQEASFIFQELVTKFGPSVSLLNSLAVSYIHQGKYDEAEKALMDAIKSNSSDPDTLINLIAVSQHQHKAPEAVAKYLAQLQRVAPQHPYVANLSTLDGAFDRLATTYASHIRPTSA